MNVREIRDADDECPDSPAGSKSTPKPGARAAPLSYEQIFGHPKLIACVRKQASTLLGMQAAHPRVSSVFATQQRWLIAHMALAYYFRNAGPDGSGGIHAAKFIDSVAAQKVASRNTADAFLKEMQKYKYLLNAPRPRDRRTRPKEPAPISIELICGWMTVHLTTLDALDGGDRSTPFAAAPEMIAAIQPIVADGLVRHEAIREPDPVFSLFNRLNEGGIVMDWLMSGLADVPPDTARIPSTVFSFDNLEGRIALSRTHLIRKLRKAEGMGSLGWLGDRGDSAMWVSAGFLREYNRQQAIKLAIIDEAFHRVLALRVGRL
jgi:hypothetical protein